MRVGEPIFWERESREIFSECHDKRRIIRFQVHINHILLLQVNINSFERLDLGHLEIFIWVSVFVSFQIRELLGWGFKALHIVVELFERFAECSSFC